MSTVAILDTSSSVCCFVFYLLRCIAESLISNTQGTDGRWNFSSRKQKAKPKPGKKSFASWIQLIGTGSVFVLSLFRAYIAFLSKSSLQLRHATVSDADVISLLFSTLIWLLFLLGTIDTVEVVGSEQYVPWMISLVFYSVTTALSTARVHNRRYHSANIGVQWARLGVLLILVFTAVFAKRASKETTEAKEAASEETQPLIQEDISKFDDDNESIISTESTESEIARDDKEDTDRAALRDRTLLQYISSFKIFIPFIRPRTWRQHFYMAITVLNTLAARLVTLGLPLTLGSLVDDLIKHKFSLSKILLYVGLRFAGSPSGLMLIRSAVSYRLNTEMHSALTRHCFNHVMELSADFHMNKSTPSTWQIMDRGNSVVTLLQDIAFRILPVIADLFIALFVITKLFGAYLCFAVATTMILLSWVNRITLTRKTSMRRKYISIWSDYYSHMNESFMHWKTVSEFNQISHEKDRHAKKNLRAMENQIQNRSFRIWLDALQEVVVTTGFLVVCLIAAREIVARRSDPGSFVTLITYWAQIMNPVTTLAGSASDISEQLVDAEKLMLLLERKPAIKEKPNAAPFEFKGGSVSFEDVVFSYDGERIVTNNVSFEAQPGETIALVGETGGGKSTLFNLLYRFFDPRSGRILVDGQDIKQVQLASYREILGLVPQNPVLFNASVMKNVRYSNLDATEEQVIEACKAAQLHDKIEKFPKKYKQRVGEMAQKLSGGELQRLAIARAILKDPKILLLDEATSAVDSVTESKIQSALQKLCKGRTTFVIAHRLSTIMGADRILVIKGGEVKECGKHEELLKNPDGAYSELWGAQLKLAKGMREKKARKDKGESSSEDETVEETLLLFDDMGGQFGENEQIELAKMLGPREGGDESRTLSVNSREDGEDRAEGIETAEPDVGVDGKAKKDDVPTSDESNDGKGKGYGTL